MKLLILLFILISFSCCTGKKKLFIQNSAKNNFAQQDTLSITAHNLSEDMSTLSTKNDEILVFIYDYSDTNKLVEPIFSKKLIFDEEIKTHHIVFQKNATSVLFLIEEDSYKNSKQIEPLVRAHFKELMKHPTYTEIQKYLGDDDLLGFQIITINTLSFEMKGRYKLDKYHYSFSF